MIHFIVHGKKDSVGVAVTDLKKEERLVGWNMETDQTLEATSRDDIPLGHKIAMIAATSGDTGVKYNVPIGKAVRDIRPGDHVHTHNLKTAR